MKKIFAAAALAAATLSLMAVSVRGQSATSSTVFVGGTEVMRVRVATGGMSTSQRAALIQERVNKFLGQGPIRPADISVAPRGNEAVVLVKGQLLFTADWATARFNRTTPMLLANGWAERMRAVLPSLTQPK